MGLRVLIADDEPIIRLGLRTILEEQGYEIVGEADTGWKAIALARDMAPDLIILDIRMPQMDGLQAARAIMAERPTAILLLTAYADRELVEEAKRCGVLAYLVKPFKEADLIPAMEIAVARFRELQILQQEAGTLRDAIEARELIEQAKRVLMRYLDVSEAEAFGRIRRLSMNSRKPLKEVAEAILISVPQEEKGRRR
ncbi:MAG: response regulator [Armatimonadota bacterium]|nr:response regulator [Armatimonadota bacterium]MDR5702140.1 response regulator [Armatimonadota bacterium]